LGRVSRIALGSVGSGAQPDEDVAHADRGLLADGELVEAGCHRPELLTAVHQPLHLIPGAVAGTVKRGRPATPGTPPGPVRLLVVALRDGAADAAGPQRRPVGPAGIGLVGRQVVRALAGAGPAARGGHPRLVHGGEPRGG